MSLPHFIRPVITQHPRDVNTLNAKYEYNLHANWQHRTRSEKSERFYIDIIYIMTLYICSRLYVNAFCYLSFDIVVSAVVSEPLAQENVKRSLFYIIRMSG